MSEKENTTISKFLSLILRHKPEAAGIELDENGWTDVKILIEKVNKANVTLNLEILKHIVETNSKKRFAFNDTFDRIRANQGHSVEVDLGYEAKIPPEILFHGTAEKFRASILEKGILKRERHHVHLSADMDTAVKVGSRHGKPFVFEVLAGKMFSDKYSFYLSENGVWLTDHVPSEYLKR
ncbi:RNA 2'-phosphotransferase [Dyadobacter flavalbus]|uniref:Probable RNA 2'-phosphotransferase n=1 Tax=Dyadobacter flavalbus TaxID=2579942 RepID=A0A5M8QWW3_9BACT|nr:RNA 2'-phosphotransferase [Dyadobacter flavalbus]